MGGRAGGGGGGWVTQAVSEKNKQETTPFYQQSTAQRVQYSSHVRQQLILLPRQPTVEEQNYRVHHRVKREHDTTEKSHDNFWCWYSLSTQHPKMNASTYPHVDCPTTEKDRKGFFFWGHSPRHLAGSRDTGRALEYSSHHRPVNKQRTKFCCWHKPQLDRPDLATD